MRELFNARVWRVPYFSYSIFSRIRCDYFLTEYCSLFISFWQCFKHLWRLINGNIYLIDNVLLFLFTIYFSLSFCVFFFPWFSFIDNAAQYVADGLTFTYSIQPGDNNSSDNCSNNRIVITNNNNENSSNENNQTMKTNVNNQMKKFNNDIYLNPKNSIVGNQTTKSSNEVHQRKRKSFSLQFDFVC